MHCFFYTGYGSNICPLYLYRTMLAPWIYRFCTHSPLPTFLHVFYHILYKQSSITCHSINDYMMHRFFYTASGSCIYTPYLQGALQMQFCSPYILDAHIYHILYRQSPIVYHPINGSFKGSVQVPSIYTVQTNEEHCIIFPMGPVHIAFATFSIGADNIITLPREYTTANILPCIIQVVQIYLQSYIGLY
ncbi:hypothetical protein GDO81_026079 [Engystomops pustulosus]|uniref:Uncharacterized protein n=1 Tax=Engystomops pustulosus TaxID=76066 RepID=A0AAV6Z0Z0_ENGPU|nr:hypothetical protein GDO81_026079 [Engystomops pustulosus]